MFRLNDRTNKPMCLGPTHEELFTIAAKSMVRSYKDLPFNLYQDADKFRDEARPRYGLIRVKEFFMKDAYSFDANDEGLNESYNKMARAYNNIFDRCGINYKVCRADTGAMGGSLSEEYQAITDIGEDTVVLCDKCDFSSNLEVCKFIKENQVEEKKELKMVETPNQESIEEVSSFLNIDVKKTVKALLMNVDNKLVVLFIRGDRELQEAKVCKLLGVSEINFADDELIQSSNAVPGYTGPIDLNAKIVIDEEILNMTNFVVGANREGYHYINANITDFKYDLVGDIVNPLEGDKCPCCKGNLFFKKGIEIGNLFKLGTKYSEKLGLTYLDEENKEQYVTMGCYGIGIGRVLASLVEQHNDESGMILPLSIAPYSVAIVPIITKDEACMTYANNIYDELMNLGIDTLMDDRDERPGVKLNDMDLIGIPIRLEVGPRDLALNKVTLVRRDTKEKIIIDANEAIEEIKKLIDSLK